VDHRAHLDHKAAQAQLAQQDKGASSDRPDLRASEENQDLLAYQVLRDQLVSEDHWGPQVHKANEDPLVHREHKDCKGVKASVVNLANKELRVFLDLRANAVHQA